MREGDMVESSGGNLISEPSRQHCWQGRGRDSWLSATRKARKCKEQLWGIQSQMVGLCILGSGSIGFLYFGECTLGSREAKLGPGCGQKSSKGSTKPLRSCPLAACVLRHCTVLHPITQAWSCLACFFCLISSSHSVPTRTDSGTGDWCCQSSCLACQVFQ